MQSATFPLRVGRYGPREAEAHAVAVVAGRAPAAIRRPAEPGVAEPTAAPEDALDGRGRAKRISGCTAWVLATPILTPLPDVANHIAKAKTIRALATHRMRSRPLVIVLFLWTPAGIISPSVINSAIPCVPGNRVQCRATVRSLDHRIPIVQRCLRPRSARILPLGLRQQPIRPFRHSFPLTQLLHKRLAILPTHILDRNIFARILEIRWITPHQLLPLTLRYFEFGAVERLSQRDLMFPLVLYVHTQDIRLHHCILFRQWTAHCETPRWDQTKHDPHLSRLDFQGQVKLLHSSTLMILRLPAASRQTIKGHILSIGNLDQIFWQTPCPRWPSWGFVGQSGSWRRASMPLQTDNDPYDRCGDQNAPGSTLLP